MVGKDEESELCRETHALTVGDCVKFVATNGQTPIRPLSGTNLFEKCRGALKRFRRRKEINAWVGEMRDEEKRRT
jgi:hypothetical protein